MALFSSCPSSEFGTLFRLLDDYDLHCSSRNAPSSVTKFTPKFDVKELDDRYELSGEFPGIEQKNINIEFVDSQTIAVSGRTEREYVSGSQNSSSKGDGKQDNIQSDKKPKHASVEDEDEDAPNEPPRAQTQKSGNKSRYWISERSVGEFYRSFEFPGPVAHDTVKASLKNGILHIVVPKAAVPKSRKIVIE